MSLFPNDKNLRVIKTARTEKEINDAVKEGYFPLLKKVERDEKIYSRLSVYQNRVTGEIVTFSDLRFLYRNEEKLKDYDEIFSFHYYPYNFPNPYAAYLIPKDIAEGEKVYLDDVIEDFIGSSHWGAYRLDKHEAVWNGKDIEVSFNEETDTLHFIG